MYSIFKSLLFKMQPETAHKFVFGILKMPFTGFFFRLFKSNNVVVSFNGFKLQSRVGLAAGMDKDAEVVKSLSDIGFGFIEVGTVTPLPQPGNPKPRLVRLVDDYALINRMGFNNQGADAMLKRLAKLRRKHKNIATIGVNIGKNKVTPLDEAYKDYLISFEKLYSVADYFVVNVSSPNTPNLRKLQDKDHLDKILQVLQHKNNELGGNKPLFVKIAPDLSNDQILDVINLVKKHKLTGIVATNTTISREGLSQKSMKISDNFGAGGLSGKPLTKRSTEIIRFIRKNADDIFIIGVGGIFTCEDAIEKIRAGANAVQIFTSFVYKGPGIVKNLNNCLSKYSDF